ncbi:MAG TPA: class IV adenylate cyclase [Candidatus Acidoferrales bacterium]
MPVHREVEIKCRVGDLAAFRRGLKRLHARPVPPVSLLSGKRKKKRGANPRVREMNFLFDTPQSALAKQGQLLRVRIESEDSGRSREASGGFLRAVLTYKGTALEEGAANPLPSGPLGETSQFVPIGRHKVREEIEVEVAEPAPLAHILEALGMRGWFRYEKFRTMYRFPGTARWASDLLIELDETPIGAFVELEGPSEAIDRAAKLLGFGPKDYITKSYLALYLEQCRVRGTTPGHMVFSAEK